LKIGNFELVIGKNEFVAERETLPPISNFQFSILNFQFAMTARPVARCRQAPVFQKAKMPCPCAKWFLRGASHRLRCAFP
jgi:hypothetical protein